LTILRRIEERGAVETAHRALRYCRNVFRYGISVGSATMNPADSLQGSLPPAEKGHFPAVTDPVRLGAILRMMDGHEGTLPVRCALRLAPLLFVRPGELRQAEWKDVDLDAAEWRFITSKTGKPLIVSLSLQAVAILHELRPLTGSWRYVFPSARSKTRPMSDNAIGAALRYLGIQKDEVVAHGFRATARTILDEVLGVRPDIIEHQLAHKVSGPLGEAYNRTKFLAERKVMMQRWADYLDELKTPSRS